MRGEEERRRMTRRRVEVRARWRRLVPRACDAAAAVAAALDALPRAPPPPPPPRSTRPAAGRGGGGGSASSSVAGEWRRYESRSAGRPFWHNIVTGAFSWTDPYAYFDH